MNYLKIFKQFHFFILFLVGSVQCTNDHYKPANITSTIVNDSSRVCFSTQIFPIIETNCALSGCHDNISKAGRTSLTSFSDIIKNTIPKNGANSYLYIVTAPDYDASMPPFPNPSLTETQRKLIKNWIDQGAKDSTGCK